MRNEEFNRKYAKERYQEFLKSEDWKLCSNLVRLREGGVCQCCQLHTGNGGNCHHTTYKFGWLPPMTLWKRVFEWLCVDCHKSKHFAD